MHFGLRVAALAASVAFVAGCRGKDEGPPVQDVSPAQAAKLIALENRGIAALERFDYSDAVAPLREASAIAPKWVAGRFNLALALIHAGRDNPAEAAAVLDGVLKDAPNHPQANFMAAWLAETGGGDARDRALELYKKAYKLTNRDPIVGAKYGAALSGIDGREKDAVAILEESHARRPSLISPVYQLSLLWRRLGDEPKAEEYQKEFTALSAHARPEIDRSTVGQSVQNAYGGMGAYSMAIRDFDIPADTPSKPLGDVTASPPAPLAAWTAGALPENAPFLGCAVFDFDQDGDLDLFVCGGDGPCALLRNDGAMKFTDVAAAAGVAVKGAYAVCAGEFDVEPKPDANARPCRRAKIDLVLMTNSGLVFLANRGDGTFVDRTKESGLSADAGGGRALLAFDADQEGDLDLFVSAGWGAKNRLYMNAGPAKFTDVAESAGLAGDFKAYGPAAAVDFDGDYDLDLVVTRPDGPPVVFANDRALKFHEAKLDKPLPKAAYGVAALGDRLVLAGESGATWLRWTAESVEGRPVDGAPGGPVVSTDLRGAGVRDLVFADGTWIPGAKDGGPSPFADGKRLFDAKPATNVVAFDADGDGVEEIVLVRPKASPEVVRVTGKPVGAALVCDFEGVIKNEAQAGWSNIEGRGALVEVKAGASLQKFRLGNPCGFGCAAPTRLVAGLGSARQADFVRIVWPDAVQQAVLDQPSGQVNCIVEEQRRPDSCPLLFSWDGARYAFVTDFLGVGGIGFLVAPGTYGKPDPTESVKIEAPLVKPRADGSLSFRVVEAMEEVCYLDKVDLQVVDHPADVTIFPDERFAGDEPFPNGDLLAYRREILPVAARDAAGADVLDLVRAVDRRWPDAAKPHPRLTGATTEQILELDFGDRLADVKPGDGIALYVNGWIEYGYTRTTMAAAGEGFTYVGPLLEAWSPAEKAWKSLVPNLGYPAGFPRVMTYDVTGKVSRETPRLRIRTNYEVYFDKVWLATKCDVARATRTTILDPSSAELRWVGYPRETKPDGRDPPVYDYGTLDPSAPWKTMGGDYTRFGDVLPLLTKSDDMPAIFGKGEEIALTFDPSTLPALPAGWMRDYVLRFDGWCKGQELYTAFGWTVEPLPFHAMSNYPFRADERYPDDDAHKKYRREWNTRRVAGGER